MAEVIELRPGDGARRRRDKAKAKARGRTLCDRGFHKWSVDGSTRFDVKAGRLVTLVRCERCDATRSELR
ncbi:MAG TPA: hypothetical protein VLA56_11275 [Pseudomonadales bacterium]|nr:hypothetical protein [Pseudomonadales bacterium]